MDNLQTERITHVAAIRSPGVIRPTPDMMARINRAAHAELDPEQVLSVPVEMSSTRLDSYFTHMAPSTLRNFAADAAAGVSVQDSHNHRQLGIGYTFDGAFVPADAPDTGTPRAVGMFYTVKGMRFGASYSFPSTDDYVAAIVAGLVRDVSVGFYGGHFTCDICGGDLMDWEDCSHYPGFEYKVEDQTVLATATIEDARLSELSVVYDGATPGASILKAERAAAEGRLPDKVALAIQNHYRSRGMPVPLFPIRERLFTGVDLSNTSIAGGAMEEQEGIQPVQLPDPVESERMPETATLGALQELTVRFEAERAAFAVERASMQDQIRNLEAEANALRPLAEVGRQYRSDLIADALREGVRAHANEFATETYRALLETASLEVIKRMRDDWRKLADGIFATGRKTQEPAVQPKAAAKDAAPDVAFMA